ncbi:hypothetical protein DFQ26_002322, partial [Actinomortierella ambigua]
MAFSLKLKSNSTSSSSSRAASRLGSTTSTPRSSIDESAPAGQALARSSNVFRTTAYALANSRL